MRRLTWSGVDLPPSHVTLRSLRQSVDKWTVSGESKGHTQPHARALDMHACATLHVQDETCLFLNWFLREYLEEPLRGLPRVFSGHSQMFNSTPTNAGPLAALQRAAATTMMTTTLANGEPSEVTLHHRTLAMYHALPPSHQSLARSTLSQEVLSFVSHPHALNLCTAIGLYPGTDTICDGCGVELLDVALHCEQCCNFDLCQACHALSTSMH